MNKPRHAPNTLTLRWRGRALTSDDGLEFRNTRLAVVGCKAWVVELIPAPPTLGCTAKAAGFQTALGRRGWPS